MRKMLWTERQPGRAALASFFHGEGRTFSRFRSRLNHSFLQGPYALRPVSQQSPQDCLQNSTNGSLVDNNNNNSDDNDDDDDDDDDNNNNNNNNKNNKKNNSNNNNNDNNNNNNNRIEMYNARFLQSPHCSANCS